MNICINFYGQQRDLQNCIEMLKNNILNKENNFYILYTGWEDEEQIIENLLEPCFIRRISFDKILFNDYLKKYSNIEVDPLNPYKTLEHVIRGLYIKQQSINTINEFVEKNNINFDIIITLRTDTKLSHSLFIDYYYIKQLGFQNIYVSRESNFDYNVYNIGATSDFIFISNYENSLKILNQLDNLEDCLIDNTNYFHPETSFCKFLRHNKFNIVRFSVVSCRSDHNF